MQFYAARAQLNAWLADSGGDVLRVDRPGLETERLILRRWRASDLDAFAALNADPQVMEFLPAILTRDQTAAGIARMEAKFEKLGFSFWALEEKATGHLAGFTGLNRPDLDAPFMPAVEIGWRLAHRFWGRGYASEAARAALGFGFGPLNLDEIVAFTARDNLRSQAVMRRLGMTYDAADDFEYPAFPRGHALPPHLLYRLRRG
jgi:RimJ/RimL family protein N-acetyltransferase